MALFSYRYGVFFGFGGFVLCGILGFGGGADLDGEVALLYDLAVRVIRMGGTAVVTAHVRAVCHRAKQRFAVLARVFLFIYDNAGASKMQQRS